MAKSKETRRLAVVAADFHEKLTDAMLAAASDEAAQGGATIISTQRVAGCYEAPLAAERALKKRKVDALVVLGCIEKGETLHGEVMGHVVHRALVEASLRHDKPVGLGIIGPGATPKQAEARKESTPRSAVRAVLRALAASGKTGDAE
ncbi:MAG TPA: 6,7-dimethyl-8-ribityllumazine synthase [Polyangiaceae bacterium]|nr:6,7-dimethyl-8-ribityllumazine synthase [Polyangiaceae bacterium]